MTLAEQKRTVALQLRMRVLPVISGGLGLVLIVLLVSVLMGRV
jgi:hypothetical protein